MIDWKYLTDAMSFYTALGYQYVEVPWWVEDDTHRLTCPNDEMVVRSDLGALVGSSEQSFLQMSRDGKIGPGRWMACTPCFRKDVEDDIHQKTFMKVELFVNDHPSKETARMVLLDAWAFFETKTIKSVIINTGPNSWDIEINGIEVGSYGYRESDDLKWVYGTGVAEPRLSKALRLGRQDSN